MLRRAWCLGFRGLGFRGWGLGFAVSYRVCSDD